MSTTQCQDYIRDRINLQTIMHLKISKSSLPIEPQSINLKKIKIGLMREAKRLFSKNKNKQILYQPSPVFKSTILRDLPNDSSHNDVGPGQYNISFPLVKPKFEAIRKNNNTIIVKVNEKLSPAFQSLQPRFKGQQKERENPLKSEMFNEENNYRQKEQQHLIHNRKIERGMKNRIKKLSQILNQEEQYRRELFSLDASSTKRLEKIQGSQETVNSIKLYKKERERLHFLMKYIRPRQQSKGVEWSKYRQTKGNLYHINNVPGPGSYQNQTIMTIRPRYYETIEDESWQFKSSTKRAYFQNSEEKIYELSPSRRRFVSDINGKFYKVDSIPLINDQSATKIGFQKQQQL